MGLISGSGSLTRYWVDEDLSQDFIEKLPEKIARYAFRNLDENSTEESSKGWVNIMDVLDNQFAAMEYLKEPYIALSFRVDKRKIPSTALKQMCRESEEKIKELENLEFIPKSMRKEIKEDAQNRLLKRAIPNSKAYDMVWNYSTGLVLFGGVNNKLCDEFSEYFLKTFDLLLQPVFPYAVACRIVESQGASAQILDGLVSGR